MAICKECEKEWTGLAECHCSGCHEHFKSLSAFDRHMLTEKGNRRCMDIEEMLAKNMVYNQDKRYWTTGDMPPG